MSRLSVPFKMGIVHIHKTFEAECRLCEWIGPEHGPGTSGREGRQARRDLIKHMERKHLDELAAWRASS